MSYTKRQFIESALEEIGLASYVFQMQPQELQSALKRLDSMVMSWQAKGITIGWPVSIDPDNADLDTVTECPLIANEAIITNLAVKLAPSYGKIVQTETKVAAKKAYNNLLAFKINPKSMSLPDTMPLGAGNKPWREDKEFVNSPEADLINAAGQPLGN